MKTRIPIKQFVEDKALSWREQYSRLMTHHLEEVALLTKRVEELEMEAEEAVDRLKQKDDLR